MALDIFTLNCCVENENWSELLNILKPKFIPYDDKRNLINPRVLAKIAATLMNTSINVPDKIKTVLLKCLMNSCVGGYCQKEFNSSRENIENSCDIYSTFSEYDQKSPNVENALREYPFNSHFPYEKVADWTVNYILNKTNGEISGEDELEILRLSVQFLCNLFTFACKSLRNPEYEDMPACLQRDDLKIAIINLSQSDHVPVVKAACAFIHNILTVSSESYYTDELKNQLCGQLMKPINLEIEAAEDCLIHLIKEPNRLRNVYEDLTMGDKLHLLNILHQALRDSIYDENPPNTVDGFPPDAIEFLSKRFQMRSDLILKTVDTYLDGVEPEEITLLLDILGTVTTKSSTGECVLQSDKSLLINCIFLLKALQMAGKKSSNHFTPVQKLSELAPSAKATAKFVSNSEREEAISDNEKRDDIKSHPAFGFKAGLIRVIGNMAYRNKSNQDLLRETETIPLLLDCCNMDARNPLIIQWTILAVRNVCENNLENQEIIRNLTKIGVVDSAVLHEMGLTLHQEQDGKAIGVVPLPRDK